MLVRATVKSTMSLLSAFLVVAGFHLVGGIAPLHKSVEKVPGSYIIKVKDGYDVDELAQFLDSHAVTRQEGGTRISHRYRRSFRGLGVHLPTAEAVEFVQNLEAVEYVAENGVIRVSSSEGAPAATSDVTSSDATSSELPWNLDRVDQAGLPLDGRYNPPNDGTGVTVYVLDTGVLPTHRDFEGRARACFDAFYGDGIDCAGHGTHVASIVAGATYGVASKAHVCGVRIIGEKCDTNGTVADVIAGIDWVAHHARKPAVATLSLNMYGEQIPLSHALDGLIRITDMTVVVAAGNMDDDACNSSPAANEQVITVGATTREDLRWMSSNWGACVDLFAPGDEITAAAIGSALNATKILSGTSAACPHVAGAAAILLADDPSLPHDGVKDLLLADATPDVLRFNRGNTTETLMDTANLMLRVQIDHPAKPSQRKIHADIDKPMPGIAKSNFNPSIKWK